MSPDLVAAAAAAALCAPPGLLVPALIGRLPEPAPDPEETRPKEPYRDIAATPYLAVSSAAACAVAGGLVGLSVGWAWPLLLVLPMVPVGVALSVIDWRTRLLPSRIVLPAHALAAVLVGVCWLLTRDTDAVVRALVGMVAVRSFFRLLWMIRSAGMGFGDVRLSALLGLVLGYLGWAELLVGIYAGFLVFGVPGLAIAVLRRSREFLRTAYPFGPFMLIGALVGIAVGPAVLASLVSG